MGLRARPIPALEADLSTPVTQALEWLAAPQSTSKSASVASSAFVLGVLLSIKLVV